jgi:hypothetical protein
MSFARSFQTSQTPGSPGEVTFTDDSTGSDGAITSRRIFIQDTEGNYIVEEGTTTEYELWPLPLSTPVTLDLLDEDIAARVVVQWLNVGNTVLYDEEVFVGFSAYNDDFDYQLTQNVASNPLLMNDNKFWANKSLLQTLISSGNNAIERASDINACQQCYNAATEMRNNSQYLFNQNS